MQTDPHHARSSPEHRCRRPRPYGTPSWASNDVVVIAVVADTAQGKRHVYTLVNRVPRARVVAVCSDQPHEIAWAKDAYKDNGIEVYGSFEDMLNHPGLQAVWISTSTDVHARQALGGIKKGLHVLCEKPLSTDLDEVR